MTTNDTTTTTTTNDTTTTEYTRSDEVLSRLYLPHDGTAECRPYDYEPEKWDAKAGYPVVNLDTYRAIGHFARQEGGWRPTNKPNALPFGCLVADPARLSRIMARVYIAGWTQGGDLRVLCDAANEASNYRSKVRTILSLNTDATMATVLQAFLNPYQDSDARVDMHERYDNRTTYDVNEKDGYGHGYRATYRLTVYNDGRVKATNAGKYSKDRARYVAERVAGILRDPCYLTTEYSAGYPTNDAAERAQPARTGYSVCYTTFGRFVRFPLSKAD